ncbi:MAG: hypothetical protein ACJAVK_002501 [Akkermansiaceae bacterium]|jgi:hypothetical protein
MSLHAQLSPEAQARLAAQKRTSTITSLIIALLLMVLVGVVLMIIAMNLNTKVIPQLVSYNGTPESEDNLKQKKVQTQIERKPAAPSSSMSKVIAAQTTSPTAIPVPEIDVPEPSTDFGDGNDFGDGWGDGDGSGSGGGFGNIPTAMKKRCSKADRLQRLTEGGGTEKCEDAVVASLRWLKESQNKDGSWTGSQPVAMTGLALLAYLGHCETAGSEEFGESVLSAITYLVDKAMKNNGKLAVDFKDNHWCYEHAIAVYALAEAYTLCVKSFGENINQLEDAVMASGQFLINSQNSNGGWAYAYVEEGGHVDTSIVGWQLQALKACKFTGLDFANLKRCAKNGISYMETMQAPSGAFGYSSPTQRGDGTTLAAVGALCFQIWESSASREARKAVKFMDKNMKFDWATADSDLYGHYYAAQCMINNGGKEWERYNALFRDQVLNNQNKDGSYKPVSAGHGLKGNGGFTEHYRTCLATLMLETYYRFLPGTGQKN